MIKNRVILLVVTIILFSLAACNSSKDDVPIYTQVKTGDLKAGESIPEPAGDVILTITGDIGTTNRDDSIVMDLATLESVGLVEYTLIDPFSEEKVTYQGVLMSDLLDLWQVGKTATTINTLAINDYRVEVPIQILRDYPILLALKANGDYMMVEDRGPSMLVFPYGFYEFERPSTDALWIWQIKSMEIE